MDIMDKMLSAVCYALYQAVSSDIVITTADATLEDMIACIDSILEVAPNPESALWYDAALVKRVKVMLEDSKNLECPECGQVFPAEQTKCPDCNVYLVKIKRIGQ